jgi:hypothetical protein
LQTGSPFIYFPAVTDAENKDYKFVVLKRADDAIVSHTVFPELAEGALQAFSDSAGIVEFGDSIVKKFRDTSSDGSVQLVKFPLSGWIDLNRPIWV